MKRSCSFFLIALAAAAPGFSLTLHAADVAWGGGDFTWNQPDADSFGADTYQDGDSVTFGNTGITDGTTGKTAIVLSGKLTPGELTFNQTGARFGGATNSPGAVGFNYYMGSNAAANYIASTGGLTLEGGNTIFANTAGSGTFSVNHTFAGDLSYSGGVMLGLRESATTRFVTLSVGSLETPIKGNSIVFNSITSANGNSSGNAWTASSSRVIVTDSKPTVSNGMVSPGLQYYTGGNTLGLFMTFSGDNLVPVTSYGSTDINTAIDSDIVNIGSSAQAVGTTKTVHAIRLGQNLTINAGVSLTLGSGGLIMGSNTISGAGTLDFGSGPGFIGAYNAASQGEISAK
ncbi:MAG: hypothetical protein MUF04_08620, partial [Akkermansiaceae bacterium]|nr:hypothetical protein [Akkermansiaceae bacterium]